MTSIQRLSPRLVVDGADAAIRFYTAALGAKEITRYADDAGTVYHSELALGDYVIMVKDADETDRAPGPDGPGVILSLDVDGVDDLAQRMVDAGATVVFPVGDSEYGRRDGRFRDPYGHLWLLSQRI